MSCLGGVGGLAHVRERESGIRFRAPVIMRERSDDSFAGHSPFTDRDAIVERNEKCIGISAKEGCGSSATGMA